MRWMVCVLFCLGSLAARGAETWQAALAAMPLGTNMTELNRTNCVKTMLDAFQSNRTVKALVFMPGATDEFYMFRRAKAALTNASPTLLDAVNALTNQTFISVTFRPPLLLLHTDEDPLEPLAVIKDLPTASRIEATNFPAHVKFNDRDWDFMLPIMAQSLDVALSPGIYQTASWHFYRHSFAGWNLNGWEALEAIAMAGKTKFTIEKNHVIFEGDTRVMAPPRPEGMENWNKN